MAIKTRKQLAAEGIATIQRGEDFGFDEKWVLVLNEEYVKKGYVFKDIYTIHWNADTIEECIDYYLEGIEKLDD